MIKNDKQLSITRETLRGFENTQAQLIADETIDPFFKEMNLNSIKEDIKQFKDEIWEYSDLKAGRFKSLEIDDFNKFAELLIKIRIAKGWTQAQLAEKINVKEQQIQRYEATDYETASLARIDEIVYAYKVNMKIVVDGLNEMEFKLPEGITPDAIAKMQRTASFKHELVPLQHQ